MAIIGMTSSTSRHQAGARYRAGMKPKRLPPNSNVTAQLTLKAVPNATPTPWLTIAAFAIVATLIAYPFRNDVFALKQYLFYGVPVLQAVLEGFGVLVATLIFTRGFRRYWSTATFLGQSPVHSLLVWITPMVVLLLVGVSNDRGVNPHVFGAFLGASISVYCLLEESGWRGFLQNASVALPPWKRSLVVGIIWYFWHLSFLQVPLTAASQVQFLLVLVVASYLLGSLVDKTRSVLLAASFHVVINMLMFSQIAGITSTDGERLLQIGLIVLVWLPMLVHWNVRKKTTQDVACAP